MAIETVKIINNTGKIISNGQHLLKLFREAKASYQEKKAAVKAERAVQHAVKRSASHAGVPTPAYRDGTECIGSRPGQCPTPSGRSSSRTSSSRHRHRHRYRSTNPQRHHARSHPHSKSALTESNLRALADVSSTASYRSPVSESESGDAAHKRPYQRHATTIPTRSVMDEEDRELTPDQQRHSTNVHRSKSEAMLPTKRGDVDPNLAYGNIPPDLESRLDLDPEYKRGQNEAEAKTMVDRIETILTEAQCVHHTASHMIQHLQENPEAAAAVALTLAELSALLAHLSPGFLGAIKAGSPAVFALLASPQFLIAAGVTVGVTIVMFGGWKIIKRIKRGKDQKAVAMSFQVNPPPGRPRNPLLPAASEAVDQALVIEDCDLEEELSTIETWRQGIAAFGKSAECADMELISPEAMRNQYDNNKRTHRTHRSTKSYKSRRHRNGGGDSPRRENRTGSVFCGQDSHHSRTEAHKHVPSSHVKTIEAAPGDGGLDLVIRPRKDNMLRSLFRKKDLETEKLTVRRGPRR